MGRRSVVTKLICSLGHCACKAHTVHKLSQRPLNADWLAPRESDSSRMRSNIFSDWLPSYIKATWPVLEILKMAGYIPDRPRTQPKETSFSWISQFDCHEGEIRPLLRYYVASSVNHVSTFRDKPYVQSSRAKKSIGLLDPHEDRSQLGLYYEWWRRHGSPGVALFYWSGQKWELRGFITSTELFITLIFKNFSSI